MFSYKLAKGTPLLEASWWKKRHGRSRSGLCKWSIKRAWNANKWTMAKCNIYTSFFSMLHTSFEVVVSLKVIFYPNGFLKKKIMPKLALVQILAPCHTERGSEMLCALKKKEEKIPHMCESIGHRSLRGRCPAPPSTLTTAFLGRAWVPLTT